MIKHILAATLLTTSAAVALEDRNNLNLNYTDTGSYYTEIDEIYNNFTNDNAELGLDGRNGIIEYGVSLKEDDVKSVNVGIVLPVGPVGLVAGVGTDKAGSGISIDNDYYGVIYEKGRIEARYTYQDALDDHKVSGRLYLTDSFGVNAGVRFDDIDNIGEDTEYTVGVSYKF